MGQGAAKVRQKCRKAVEQEGLWHGEKGLSKARHRLGVGSGLSWCVGGEGGAREVERHESDAGDKEPAWGLAWAWGRGKAS